MPEREHVPVNSEPEIAPEPGEIWLCEGVGEEFATGDVWVVRDRATDFVTKGRPAVIVQDTASSGNLDSMTMCLLTSYHKEAFYRIPVERDSTNGLHKNSWLMVDKVTTMKAERLLKRIGTIDEATLRDFYVVMMDFMVPNDFLDLLC